MAIVDPFEVSAKKSTGIVDPFESQQPISSIDQSQYPITQSENWKNLPEGEKISYSTVTPEGKRVVGTKNFNQFTPGETPLSQVPKKTERQKTYGVNLKSKKALADNQIEMLKRNPDFKAMSPLQQAQLLGQNADGGFTNPYENAGLMEAPRFAAEAIITPINAAKKVATDIGTIGRTAYGAVKGLLPGNDFMTELDKGAFAGTKMQEEFKPWETGMEPSVTGAKIGEFFNAGRDAATSSLGEVGGKLYDVATNTMMFAPVAKGVLRRTPGVVGPDGKVTGVKSGIGPEFTERSPVGNVINKAAEALKTTPSQGKFREVVSSTLPKIAPGTKAKGTPKMRQAYDQKAATAMQEIIRNKELLNLTDEHGEQIPLPRNRVEFAEALDQTKDVIFNEYNAKIQQAGEHAPPLEMEPIKSQLQSIIDDPVNQTEAPAIVKHAQERLEAYNKLGRGYTFAEAQQAVKMANERLKAVYSKGATMGETVLAVVDAGIAKMLRSQLDDAITKADGPGYQDLKNRYGALKAIEEDVNRAANRQRNVPGGKVDFSDVYTASKMALAIAKADPAIAASAAGGLGIKKLIQRGKPDPVTERTFKKLEKLLPKDEGFVGPEDTGHVSSVPRDKFVPPEMRRTESPLVRPEDVEPSAREAQPQGFERTSTPNPPQEFDPSLRDIAPQEPTELNPLREQQRGVQHEAGGAPKGDVRQTMNAGAPGELAGNGSIYHESSFPSQQAASPIDLKAAISDLQSKGFSAEEAKNMAQVTVKPTIEKAVGGNTPKQITDAAKKYGVPAAMVAAYMLAPDDKKAQFAAMPIMAGMLSKIKAEHNAKVREVYKSASEKMAQEGVTPKMVPINEGGVKGVRTLLLGKDGKPIMSERYKGMEAGVSMIWDSTSGKFVFKDADIPDRLRGADVGTAFYHRMAEMAHEKGKEVQSDPLGTSNAAQKVYPKLQEMGMDVKQHPDAVATKTQIDVPNNWVDGAFSVAKRVSEDVKKAGGGTKGIGKVALQYGVPAALLAKFLSSDDEGKKKMLTTTVLRKLNQRL